MSNFLPEIFDFHLNFNSFLGKTVNEEFIKNFLPKAFLKLLTNTKRVEGFSQRMNIYHEVPSETSNRLLHIHDGQMELDP